MKKILFIVPYPEQSAPSQRFRLEHYIPLLKEHRWQVTVSSFAQPALYRILYKKGHTLEKIFFTCCGFLRRFFDVLRCWHYDIIFVHREAAPFGPPVFELFFKALGKKLIFDFDDSIFLSSPVSFNRSLQWLKCPGKVRKILTISDCAIAGNAYLADFACDYNAHVYVFPSTVDTCTHTPSDQATSADRSVCIGWCGSPTTTKHLQLLNPVFQRLAERYPVIIKVIGAADYRLNAIEVIDTPWSREREVEELCGIDIGVMPLPDEQWAQGKCGMKALLYMACGIATVCSPVGVNAEIIHHGHNGLLAATEDEWFEALSSLIEDSALRRRLGEAGRATIEQSFSVQATALRYEKILQSIIDPSLFERVRKKILHIITDLDVGGTPTVLKTIIERSGHTDYELTVCSLKRRSEYTVAESIEACGARLLFLNAYQLTLLPSIWRLYLFIRDERPDIIHTWLFHANVLGRVLGHCVGGSRIISSERTIDRKKSSVRVFLDRLTFRWADIIVTNARAVKETLCRREGLSPESIIVIPNGVDTDIFSPQTVQQRSAVRAQFGIADETYLIGCIARLDPVKDHHLLIDAFSQVRKRIPTAQLMVVGGGAMKRALMRHVRKKHLIDAVTFAGTRRDIPAILSALDLFVLPSREEGFPGSVLEAMAMQKAIIATRVGGVPEMLENGVTGIIVEPGDKQALARGIEELHNAPSTAYLLGVNARRVVEKRFAIVDKITRLFDEYEKLLKA